MAQRGRGPPPRSWHAEGAADVVRSLDADIESGLSAAEVATRRAEHGANRLAEREGPSAIARFAAQFRSVLIGMLAAAAVVAFLLGETIDGIAILTIIVLKGSCRSGARRRPSRRCVR